MALLIRDVREAELDSLLALNNAAGPGILPIDTRRLRHLFEIATYFRVAEIDGRLPAEPERHLTGLRALGLHVNEPAADLGEALVGKRLELTDVIRGHVHAAGVDVGARDRDRDLDVSPGDEGGPLLHRSSPCLL